MDFLSREVGKKDFALAIVLNRVTIELPEGRKRYGRKD